MRRIAFILIIVVSFVAVSAKNQKVDPCLEDIQKLQEQIVSKDAEIVSLQQKLDTASAQLAVYEFFNNEEISIFADTTLEQNGCAQKLTGKNKITYETIRMIANIEHAITDIDNKVLQLQQQQQTKKWSNSELKNAIRLEIKADMNDIGDQLDIIEMRDLSILSGSQFAYYKKQLERFDAIFIKYL